MKLILNWRHDSSHLNRLFQELILWLTFLDVVIIFGLTLKRQIQTLVWFGVSISGIVKADLASTLIGRRIFVTFSGSAKEILK
jgi:hypothetical protein